MNAPLEKGEGVDKDSLANKLVREILSRIFAGEYAIDSRLPPERA